MSASEILAMIESLRLELTNLAQFKPLNDPEMLALSQTLDSYLNQYNKLSTGTKGPTSP